VAAGVVEAGLTEHLLDRGLADPDAHAGELVLDPVRAPERIVGLEPDDEVLQILRERRPVAKVPLAPRPGATT